MLRHHLTGVASSAPINNQSMLQIIVFSIAIAAGIIAIMAAIAYFFADRREQKEVNEILRKNGIKKD